MATSLIEHLKIDFDSRQVPAAIVSHADDMDQVIKEFNLNDFDSIILMLGGADNLEEELNQDIKIVLLEGLMTNFKMAKSIFLDGGTYAGIMKLTGEVIAWTGYKQQIIGVAPEGAVIYSDKKPSNGVELDPNHSCFLLIKGGKIWGDETGTLFKLAERLAWYEIKSNKKRPQVVILIGGGKISAKEIVTAAQNGIPIIVIAGTGGLADELYTAHKKKGYHHRNTTISEILANGDLCFHQLTNSSEILKKLIDRKFETDRVLLDAWHQFADFNLNADIQQKLHKKFQAAILILGIAAAALAIIWKVVNSDATLDHAKYNFIQWVMYILLILLPIALTVLIAASNKFKNGTKWIFFRAGAEAIKREIYTYRTRTGAYRKDGGSVLSQRVSQITGKAMRTDINHSFIRIYSDQTFPPYMELDKGGDDGFGQLNAESYIKLRLCSQIDFYKGKTKKMSSVLIFYQWASYIITGIGTLLAVIEQQIWIALTTSIVAAIATWLGYQQWDNTIGKYNQCANDLHDILRWWEGLTVADQFKRGNIDNLVAHTEQALQKEYDGWAQQMQQTIAEFNKQQEDNLKYQEKSGMDDSYSTDN